MDGERILTSETKWVRSERTALDDAEDVLEALAGPPFGILKQVVVLVVGLAAAIVAAVHLSLGVKPVGLGVAVGMLATTGLLVEVLLHCTKRRLDKERGQVRVVWARQCSQLRDIATRDELTQLPNRRYYYDTLEVELARAVSKKKSLSLLFLDVDDLKAINDEFGHPVGDVVLRKLGSLLLELAAGTNRTPVRLGGDEFAIILPGADRREADQLAWQLWQKLADSPLYETDYASIYLGVSIGSSGYPWGGTTLDEIARWADTKLYANKLERKGFANRSLAGQDNRLTAVVVEVLSTALDVRDRMTHRHARRVARTAAAIARALNLPNEQVQEIEYAAALHDIGKIGVADNILRKPEALDEEEWKEMRRHSEMGYQILKGIDFFKGAAEVVYAHHERYDGRGYPRGLAGDEIPFGARVFAVVDSYDAMTSRRSYRGAMSREAALMEVARNSGTQFDPLVVEAFLKVIRTSPDGFYEEGSEDVGLQLKPGAELEHDNHAPVPQDAALAAS